MMDPGTVSLFLRDQPVDASRWHTLSLDVGLDGPATMQLDLTDSAIAPGDMFHVHWGDREWRFDVDTIILRARGVGWWASVRALDPLARLNKSPHIRSYRACSDGDLVRALAQAHGLTASVQDEGVQHAWLLQHGCTDLAFLRERARLCGCAIYWEDEEVRFVRLPNESPSARRVEAWRRLRWEGRRSTWATVRGWDGPERMALSSGEGGRLLASVAGSAAEMDRLAGAVAHRQVARAQRLELELPADPCWQPLQWLALDDRTGDAHGSWWVARVQHRLGSGAAAVTILEGRRPVRAGDPHDVAGSSA